MLVLWKSKHIPSYSTWIFLNIFKGMILKIHFLFTYSSVNFDSKTEKYVSKPLNVV